MKKTVFIVSVSLLFIMACGSQPPAEQTAVPEVSSEVKPAQVEAVSGGETAEEVFDPGIITQELFDYTKSDVQQFIEGLNRIIRARDYDAWAANLGEEYFEEKSSPEYLAEISQQPRLRTQRIVLKSANDYFLQVVVPSRANDHVDDIEFVTQNRVKAYTLTANGQRLRLYDLERSDNGWKIIN
jgi:hypothetical protein